MFFYKHSPPLPPCLPWTVIELSNICAHEQAKLCAGHQKYYILSQQPWYMQHTDKPETPALPQQSCHRTVHASVSGPHLTWRCCPAHRCPRRYRCLQHMLWALLARAVAAWREGQWHVVKIKLKLNWKSAVGCRVARWSLATWCQQVYAAGNGLLMWGWKRGNFSDWPSFT